MVLLKNDFNDALNALLENMIDDHIEECKEKYSTDNKKHFKVTLKNEK